MDVIEFDIDCYWCKSESDCWAWEYSSWKPMPDKLGPMCNSCFRQRGKWLRDSDSGRYERHTLDEYVKHIHGPDARFLGTRPKR